MTVASSFSCGHFTRWILLSRQLYFSNYFLIATLFLLSIPSALFNSLVFIVIWRTPSLQTPSNIFLCNLAVSDLAVAAIAAPLTATWKLLEIYDSTSNLTCTMTYIACIITSAFGSFSFYVVTAATVDRHLALKLHLRYPSKVTSKRVVFTCVVLLVSSLILSSLTLVGATEFTVGVLISSFACLVVMNYCYLKIFLVLRRHHIQIQSHQVGAHPGSSLTSMRRYRKTVTNLLYVLVLYLLLYLPFICAALAREITGNTVSTLHLMNLAIALAFLTSFVNPLVCCLRIKEFRAGIKAILPYHAFLATLNCCK